MSATAATLSHVFPIGSRVNERGRLEIGGCDAIDLAREFGTPAYIVAEDDVPAIFALASVLVFPSQHEGFGLAALEALAARTPLVASNRRPLTEFLDDSCAVLVDPDSVDAITRGVLLALGGSLDRVRAGARVADRHSWECVAMTHVAQYRQHLRARSERAATNARA